MTPFEILAAGVVEFGLSDLTAAQIDRLELHVADTLGALELGARTDAGLAMARLAAPAPRGRCTAPGDGAMAAPGQAITAACAVARCSEADDIHLGSCTTPGACVVPTALALASAGRLDTPRGFLEAVAVGYELMVRVGLAIDGPRILLHGVWPSLFAAPMGAAAVEARARGLDRGRVAGALATALLASNGGAPGPGRATTSRWLLFGEAARRGALAAEWASAGLLGDPDVLARRHSVAGVAVDSSILAEPFQVGRELDRVGFKPYPIARQALAAVEACRELAEAHGVDAGRVDEVIVRLPAAQRAIVDRIERPEGRLGSLVSVQYRVAVALEAPARLRDPSRGQVFMTPTIERLMPRVRVVEAPELEHHYPDAWPARVTVRVDGRTLEREVLHPDGDPESGFGWADVEQKMRVATDQRRGPAVSERIVAAVRGLHAAERLPPLWNLGAVA